MIAFIFVKKYKLLTGIINIFCNHTRNMCMRNHGSNEGNDIIVINPNNEANSIKSFKQVIPVSIYHFYITDEIGEADKYLELINILKTAEEHDTIFIYLNTPGGNLNTTIQLIAAMKQSAATVVTCLEGEVCSAGTLIFLSGHKFVVNQHCTFMIHNYSQWAGGKGNELVLRVKYSESYFKKLAYDIYGKFLNEHEIELVLNGKDIWLDSDEVSVRLNAIAEAEQQTEIIIEANAAEILQKTATEITETAIENKKKRKK